jgi:hypothetical protein
MASPFNDRLRAVWQWQRTAARALDGFEREVREQPERYIDPQWATNEQELLQQIGRCREELEDFALLSHWAIFEAFVNDWWIRRTRWADIHPDADEKVKSGLAKRIEHWSFEDKLMALKPWLGDELTAQLNALRRWRDWVAHRKQGPRPDTLDFDQAQSLLIAAITKFELVGDGVEEELP